MTVRRYLTEIGSHRDHLDYLDWLRRSLNEPSRSDFYLMQIAAEVRRANVKDPSQVDTNKFRMRFESRPGMPARSVTRMPAEVAALSKSIWAARLGIEPPSPQE